MTSETDGQGAAGGEAAAGGGNAEPEVVGYLRELVALTGPSGSEEDVVRLVARSARELADEIELDAFGNVIATRRAADAGARRCVVAAHMDEVGFRVRKVDSDGYLRFEKVGGTDDRVLPARRVWVRTERGRLLGVIGTKSAHLLKESERTTVVPYADLYVDIGARTAEEAAASGVQVGDPIGFVADLAELGEGSGRYTGHAFDDRAGCAVLLALLERFRAAPPPATIVAVFSVQEEVGLRGAHAAARSLRADVALSVDMTAVDDTPDAGGRHLRLGAGPAVKLMDGSVLTHPAVRRGLLAAAERAGVAAQREILRGIGTDAGALQYAGGGVPTGAVSVGNRYTHSPVEVLDRRDLEDTVALLHRFVLDLPEMDLRFTTLD